MIENFSIRETYGTRRQANGFVCGSMGIRDVKIYCNEVSGSFETYSIATLTEFYDYGFVSLSYLNREVQRRGLHET